MQTPCTYHSSGAHVGRPRSANKPGQASPDGRCWSPEPRGGFVPFWEPHGTMRLQHPTLVARPSGLWTGPIATWSWTWSWTWTWTCAGTMRTDKGAAHSPPLYPGLLQASSPLAPPVENKVEEGRERGWSRDLTKTSDNSFVSPGSPLPSLLTTSLPISTVPPPLSVRVPVYPRASPSPSPSPSRVPAACSLWPVPQDSDAPRRRLPPPHTPHPSTLDDGHIVPNRAGLDLGLGSRAKSTEVSTVRCCCCCCSCAALCSSPASPLQPLSGPSSSRPQPPPPPQPPHLLTFHLIKVRAVPPVLAAHHYADRARPAAVQFYCARTLYPCPLFVSLPSPSRVSICSRLPQSAPCRKTRWRTSPQGNARSPLTTRPHSPTQAPSQKERDITSSPLNPAPRRLTAWQHGPTARPHRCAWPPTTSNRSEAYCRPRRHAYTHRHVIGINSPIGTSSEKLTIDIPPPGGQSGSRLFPHSAAFSRTGFLAAAAAAAAPTIPYINPTQDSRPSLGPASAIQKFHADQCQQSLRRPDCISKPRCQACLPRAP